MTWKTINDVLKATNEVFANAMEDESTPEKVRSQTGALKAAIKTIALKLELAKATNHPVGAVDKDTKSLPDVNLY
jgi:hypothetical protein